MKGLRIRDPHAEATALLKMDAKQASLKFQQYTVQEQLAIIETVPDAKNREELYYLVPDCTELVQRSSIEGVMQMGLAHLGTGQSAGILSAASSEQLAEIIDLVAYQNGQLNETQLEAWLMEMLHGGDEVFEKALRSIDVNLLGEFFMGRLTLEPGPRFSDSAIPYPGWIVEEALVNTEDLTSESEDIEMLIEMLYAADGELFQALMEYIFLEDPRALHGWDGFRQRETRESITERIQKQDEEKGITEEDLEKLVDLDNIELDESESDDSQSESSGENDQLEWTDLDNIDLDNVKLK